MHCVFPAGSLILPVSFPGHGKVAGFFLYSVIQFHYLENEYKVKWGGLLFLVTMSMCVYVPIHMYTYILYLYTHIYYNKEMLRLSANAYTRLCEIILLFYLFSFINYL